MRKKHSHPPSAIPPDRWTRRPDRPRPPQHKIDAAKIDIPEVLAGGENVSGQWEEDVTLLVHYLMDKGHSGLAIEWGLFELADCGELVLSDCLGSRDTFNVRSTGKLWESWANASDPTEGVSEGVSERAAPPQEGGPERDAPPNWEFEPGRFTYRQVKGEVGGSEIKLLKELAKAGRRLTLDDLRERVWGDPGPEDATIRSVISRLRSKLRAAFGLGQSEDPIPCHGGGYELKLPSDR
jgi:hypothetical protein